jgi:hypothetical protein
LSHWIHLYIYLIVVWFFPENVPIKGIPFLNYADEENLLKRRSDIAQRQIGKLKIARTHYFCVFIYRENNILYLINDLLDNPVEDDIKKSVENAMWVDCDFGIFLCLGSKYFFSRV